MEKIKKPKQQKGKPERKSAMHGYHDPGQSKLFEEEPFIPEDEK